MKYFRVTCNSNSFPHNEVGNVVYVKAGSSSEAGTKAVNHFNTTTAERYARGIGISERIRTNPNFSLTPKFHVSRIQEVSEEATGRWLVIDSDVVDGKPETLGKYFSSLGRKPTADDVRHLLSDTFAKYSKDDIYVALLFAGLGQGEARTLITQAGISDSVLVDGKVVAGEGSNMDGIPYGKYVEGGRSYRGFEITSEDNGLRKGVYRFYAFGGGAVAFGNSARDGQFTESQFQKLIGEGKVKLLDSIADAKQEYVFNWQDRYNNTKERTPVSANTVGEAIRKLADIVAQAGVGTANAYVVSVSPNDGYAALYGKLSDLVRSHVNDAGVHAEQTAQEKYDKLIAKHRELTSEIERNDNNPNFNIQKVYKELDSVRGELERIKKDWGYALRDSVKMFKVTDRVSGRVRLVRASDSLAAVKKVSNLKDTRYELIVIKNGETDSEFVDANSASEALSILSERVHGARKLEFGVHRNGEYQILKSYK